MNNYKLILDSHAIKDLKKIDKSQAKIIINWIEKNLNNCSNPRHISSYKNLTGNLKGHVRYRIGSYRIICEIQDDKLIIIAVAVGHRKEIYKKR